MKIGAGESPRPCTSCGGTNFDARPPLHQRFKYELTQDDRNFLRSNRIDPEED